MKNRKSIKKYLFYLLLFFIIGLPVFIFGSDKYIQSYSKSFIYDNINNTEKHKVGLVLGTSKYLVGGGINVYYSNRIKTTIALYESGKIDFVLVSGDNGTTQYNEPSTFKNDLIKGGIPADKIILDYAGFRTLDSVIRAKEVFGQTDFIIISQKFHIERAIFLARSHDINAFGYKAGNYTKKASFWLRIREKLARSKAVLDIIFNKQPKFLGEKIIIQ